MAPPQKHTSPGHESPPRLFVDEEFPARWHMLSIPSVAAAWMRPHETSERPRLFVEGTSRFDVHQGFVGDCWFMAACAAIAERPDLLKKVIPEEQVLYGPGYDGSVTIRLWHLGEWEDVRIDDRLPVDAAGAPVYARNRHRDEFWLPLLEKAFAKFHGRYKAIEGGWLCEALVPVTGFYVENLVINNWTSDKTFNIIKEASEKQCLIICCNSKPDYGLPSPHAYTITKVFHQKEIEGQGEELRLVRVRNPWGNEVKWAGAWSDGDERWKKLRKGTKEESEGVRTGNDGEFWMDMKDFAENFSHVGIAMERPGECETMKIVCQLGGCWTGEENGGGPPDEIENFARNPQFSLVALVADKPLDGAGQDEAVDPMAGLDAVIELMQDINRSVNKRNHMLQIAFFVFEASTEKKLTARELLQLHHVTGCTELMISSAVRSRVRMRPGRRYIVVPCASAPAQSGRFLFRVFSRRARVRLVELPPS